MLLDVLAKRLFGNDAFIKQVDNGKIEIVKREVTGKFNFIIIVDDKGNLHDIEKRYIASTPSKFIDDNPNGDLR